MEKLSSGYNPDNNVKNLFDLRGKIALISGASFGGLGYYYAEAFVEAGAKVAISDISSRSKDLEIAFKKLVDIGGDVRAYELNVSNEKSVKTCMKEISKDFGRLNILLNNAGVTFRKEALQMELDEWKKVIETNLTGTWLIDREVAGLMIKNGYSRGGRIINVSSQLGKVAGKFPESSYYASKAGIINLTRALAKEWGQFGINVNCIAPGLFYPTNMTETISEDSRMFQSLADRTLKGRFGNPAKDLKGISVFLASEASEYITGQTIFVDGGWTAW